ncbi:apolipoprotein M [Myxocyprinus asiaticus]|uniref:apolipoprotein M n=1 Tax=Myxocyprinus asiaticus TaxID=70543 RepID=UPI002221F25A|nr:apolipoprotein M [Myxocyprinus asiaticus]
MLTTLWGIFGSVVSLLYAGLQGMVPCLPPAPLPSSVINTDQYMGNWYFVAAAAWDEDGIKALTGTDSSYLHIQKSTNSTLTVTEKTRGEECQTKSWDYFVYSVTDPFLLRTDFEAAAVIWDGKWINCPSCILILMMDENDEMYTLLYNRNETTTDEVMQEFKSKMECVLMEDLIKAPKTNGYCK